MPLKLLRDTSQLARPNQPFFEKTNSKHSGPTVGMG